MKNFRAFNLITGWSVFLISAVVYLLTIEPTTSFWDCGEFITSSFKLEVGHPPGAPFFMLTGRFFTLFTSDVEKISVAMNSMSALASAFTILFLFWTITHLARKIILVKEEDFNLNRIIAVMGAGAVGALAYTFSDSFWFSAAEAEVYATSSLFTAIVLWAILKWENVAGTPHANKWIILIAYLMGLSIGVHLLNLLAIPAIVLVYYFKRYKATAWGIIASLLVSGVILGSIMFVIIPGMVAVASWIELGLVNGFSLPYHSGLLVFVVILSLLLSWLVYYTHKRGLTIWNTVILAITVVAIGYSTYGVIIIRSNADTPLNESSPNTVFSLLKYLNRDQYGQTPLVYGNYFNAPAIEQIEGKPTWYKEDGKYVKVSNPDYKYSDKFKGLFPRMWSEQQHHINQYLYWAKMKESDLYQVVRDESGNPVRDRNGNFRFDHSQPLAKPTFAQNMRFFFKYQVGFMYLRYFMWNFAGRQNDNQGQGELTNGNWISGIPFIDNARLGNQDQLPDYMKENRARNKYYLLPFLLGMVGLFFHYQYHKKDFWVVMALFLLTGLAIVVYLNQYPIQPRERDYAYVGSFYAFAIWIGLGVLGLINAISKHYKSLVVVSAVVAVSLMAVPGLMAMENWDDHDRSGRYTARDFAFNYLNSCDENGIIFTNGDNDTFPLWYIQEVEGVRTDVRVINLSYFTADWYISQMQNKLYDSDPVKFTLNQKQYRNGTRDYILLADGQKALLNEKYKANENYFKGEYQEIYITFMALADKSKLPQIAPKDYSQLQKGPSAISLETLVSAVGKIERRKSEFGFEGGALSDLIHRIESLAERVDEAAMPLDAALNFIVTDDPRFKQGRHFFPGTKFVIKVDTASVRSQSGLSKDELSLLVPEMRFDLGGSRGVPKNSLMMMDLISEVNKDNWKRPVYYAVTASKDNYLNMEKYLHREGLTYRLLPAEGLNSDLFLGSVNTEKMYENTMNIFRWGNIQDPTVYLDENNLRMLTNFRYTFASLASALIQENKQDSAVKVLDRGMELMPNSRVPFNYAIVPFVQFYYDLGEMDKANAISREFAGMLDQELTYYEGLQSSRPAQFNLSSGDFSNAGRNLYTLFSMANTYQQKDLMDELSKILQAHENIFQGALPM